MKEDELRNEINRNPVDRLSADIGNFAVEGTHITATLAGNGGDLLMLPVIDTGRTFAFMVRILCTKERYISIGIVDRGQRNRKDWPLGCPFYVGYFGRNGQKYPGGLQEGRGFSKGDQVETVVNLRKNKVEWRVNGALQATSNAPKQGKEFVPYIAISHSGDSVEWLGCGYLD